MRLFPSALFLLLPGLLSAQLRSTAVPSGLVRLEIGGSFGPVNQVWRNGHKENLGELLSGSLDARHTPLAGDLEKSFQALLGEDIQAQNLGSLSTTAQLQRNIALITAGWGVSPRTTLFVNLPLVSVRNEMQLRFDPSGATLGINPASGLGSSFGQAQTNQYLTGLASTLTSLQARIDAGDLSAEALARAQAAIASGTAMQQRLEAVVGSTSLLLPLADSPEVLALQEKLASYAVQVSNMGISPPPGAPAFPTTALTANSFNSLLSSTSGAAYRIGSNQPITSLGRIEIGVWREVFRREGTSTQLIGHARALVRLGTGSEPDPYQLLDFGTGGKSHELEFGGNLDLQRKLHGLRVAGSFRLPLAATVTRRLGSSDDLLLPSSRISPVSHREGSGFLLRAEPWVALTRGFSITGLALIDQRARDSFTLLGTNAPGLASASLAEGTGGTGVRVGLGVSYYHDGRHHTGGIGLPEEAGFSIERTLKGTGGLVLSPLTTRLYFRFHIR